MSSPQAHAFVPHALEYLVIVGYFLLLIIIGWLFKRLSSDTSDYFRGGCRGTWWLVGASVFMSQFSAWTFTGAAGVAYNAGWSVMIIYLGNVLGFLLNFAFTGAWLRQLRATTAPEVIRMRFGGGTQLLYAFISVPLGMLYSGLHLYGLGIFCAAVFGFDIILVILVVGIVVLAYATSGGRWAVMATDFLQGVILVPMTVLVGVLAVIEIGGFGALFEAVQTQGLERDFRLFNSTEQFAGSFTIGWAVAMITKQIIGYNTLSAAPRFFSVKDGRSARKAALLAAVLMGIGAFIWFLPPMIARLTIAPEVAAIDIAKPAEASYALISLQLLPAGLAGLVVVAILTATMSSMDTGLNVNAAIIIKDLYPALCRWRKTEPRAEGILLRYSRLISLILGVCIIGLAMYFSQLDGKGIFELMLDVGALLAIPMATPLFWSLFMRKVPMWAAIFTIGMAFIPSFLGAFSESFFGETWTFQMKLFSVFLTGSAAFFATRPFWFTASTRYREQVNAFYEQMHRPIDFEKEVGKANDWQQLRMIGRFAMAIGLFILALMLLPNPWSGRLVILILGLIVFSLGVLMNAVGTRARKNADT